MLYSAGVPTPIFDATFQVSLRSSANVRSFLDGVRRLSNAAPLELEVAMLVAWLGNQDPEDLGYSSMSAFYAEHVDWHGTWRKRMAALVRSDRDDDKRAACDGRMPLRSAVEPQYREPRIREPVDDEAVAAGIFAARRAARICLGRASSEAEVDDYLLACHQERRSEAQIFAEARTPPPAPVALPLSWDWCRGLFEEPASIAEARERLDQRQAVLRGRHATHFPLIGSTSASNLTFGRKTASV